MSDIFKKFTNHIEGLVGIKDLSAASCQGPSYLNLPEPFFKDFTTHSMYQNLTEEERTRAKRFLSIIDKIKELTPTIFDESTTVDQLKILNQALEQAIHEVKENRAQILNTKGLPPNENK